MNNTQNQVSEALASIMKHTGSFTYWSLKDDYIFKEVDRREDFRASGLIEPEAGAARIERQAKDEYTRTEIAMIRDLAEGRWAWIAGRMASRVEMLHAICDTAEPFQTYGIKCCMRFRRVKVCVILAWYEVWRKAVLNLADMYECLDTDDGWY
jgi:hypothetical protein